jgi:release factor glutamine methyltransferase
MTTRGAALAAGRARLAAAGLDAVALEARILLCHAIGCTPEVLVGWPERPVEAAEAATYDALLVRRAAREPIAHLVGHREFWGLSFRVSPATLVPRPDSETLIEAALSGGSGGPPPARILDIGTGTGCLLISLLRELPGATGVGIDIVPAALDLARANSVALGVADRSAWLLPPGAAGGRFDLVLANLPYVPTAEIATLDPDVRDWEPASALDGGADGLDVFRQVLPRLPTWLASDGRALLEIGPGQAAAVEAIAVPLGLAPVRRWRDLAGIERVIELAIGAKCA